MNTILQGDCLAVLKTLPANLVQCCVTSPPYYCLRDYGVAGQIGLEETPQAYIDKVVQVFREVRRVLKDDGVLWLNLGDSYANDQQWGGHSSGKHRKELHTIMRPRRFTGLPGKNLLMIPARVAIALQEDGWILRQDCIWHKPNCMPESVTDRPTTAHEHIFLFAKCGRYFYNAEAIRETGKAWTGLAGTFARAHGKNTRLSLPGQMPVSHRASREDRVPPGHNKRSVWTVISQPYPEAHFATMPPKLVEPCILAGSHPGDIILDPFCGAGTVPMVALQHHRSYLGIELNPAYIAMANKRLATVQPTLWGSEAQV
jgi:DNA modification methylase